MTILLAVLVGAAIGGVVRRVLPSVSPKPKYAPGDKVWAGRASTPQRGVVLDVSNGAYFVSLRLGKYPNVEFDMQRITFREGIKRLALREEEAA